MNIKDLIFGKKVAATQNGVKHYAESVQGWLPISDIRDGVIITKDGRFVKLLEVLPVNFYLKSAMEQQNIIYYFSSYLKIAPDRLQFLAVTQKADIDAYIQRMWRIYDAEENESCRDMIADNIAEIAYLADREALTRRFFVVLQYEPRMKLRGNTIESIIQRLNEEADIARNYLDLCGLEVLEAEYSDIFLSETLYELLNRKTSHTVKLPLQVFSMVGEVCGAEEQAKF